MDNGKKLADVVGAVDRAEMKHHLTGGKINAPVFHRTGITAACRVDSPSVCPYTRMQGQNSIVSVIWRISHYKFYIRSGTSIPSRAIPFLMVFATFLAITKRTVFSCSVSALRIE